MNAANVQSPLACLLLQLVCIVACGTRATPTLDSTLRPVAADANLVIAEADSARLDFNKDVLPIVSQCRPCHFEGGKMYAQLPFDDPKTIRKLGTHLFSRIKDEKEQAVLRAYLALPADSTQHASLGERKDEARH